MPAPKRVDVAGRCVDVETKSRRQRCKRKRRLSRNFAKPSDGLEPSTPSLPSRVPGKQMQLQAAGCKESRGFRTGGVSRHLRGVSMKIRPEVRVAHWGS